MGIAGTGNNFGGLVMPPVAVVILALVSWQGTYLAVAALMFLTVAFTTALVREAPPHTPTHDEDPSEPRCGLAGGLRTTLAGWTLRQALRTRTFYLITLACSFGSFPFAALIPHVVAHLENEGVSLTTASLALSVLAGFGMAGKILFGLLAERITARYAMMVSYSVLAIGITLMRSPWPPVIMWLCVVLFGFGMGAFGTLRMLAVQENFGLRSFGSIAGLMSLTSTVTFAVGPLLSGLVFDTTGSYSTAFAVVAVLLALGVILLSQASPPGTPREPAARQGATSPS